MAIACELEICSRVVTICESDPVDRCSGAIDCFEDGERTACIRSSIVIIDPGGVRIECNPLKSDYIRTLWAGSSKAKNLTSVSDRVIEHQRTEIIPGEGDINGRGGGEFERCGAAD